MGISRETQFRAFHMIVNLYPTEIIETEIIVMA